MEGGKSVLVVDDDAFFRTILNDALRQHYRVFEAAGGEEATRLIPIVRPDLIILDIEMPDRNGIDICKELKKEKLTRNTPILLITSRTKKQDLIIGLHAGADDYLIKPICLPEVIARVDSHLSLKKYYTGLQNQDLKMLLDLSNAISVMRNPMNIMKTTVEKMTEVVDAYRISIVSGGMDGDLFVKASSDLNEETQIRLDKNRYPEVMMAIDSKKAVAIRDITKDPLMAPVRGYLAGSGLQAILVVPIIKKQIAIGTLLLRMVSTHKDGIPERVYNLCHLVANISANALENAALFESMKTAQEFLEEESIRDGLTRLFTHQHFYARLEEEFSRAVRHLEALSLIFFDIDNFKLINDTYGHYAGDEVLRKIGHVVLEVTRDSDVQARYGGEEFAILLPKTHADGALEMARRLSVAIGNLRLACIENKKITISSGVTTLSVDNHKSSEKLIQLADIAMYKAKDCGKNKTVWMA
jgi:two-component system, cell cycle response regulator